MNRILRSVLVLVFFGAVTVSNVTAEAAFVVKGSGEEQQIDATALAPHLREGYQLFMEHCVHCHPQARTLKRLQVYTAGQEEALHAELRVMLVKMLRLPGSTISAKEGKKVLDFLMELHRLYDEVKKTGK